MIKYNYSQTLLTNQSSFAEALFNDKVDYILNESAWQAVSEHHLFYLHCLLCTYEQLQKLMHEYVDQYLDDTNIPNLQNEFDALYYVPKAIRSIFFKIKSNELNIKSESENKNDENKIKTNDMKHIRLHNNESLVYFIGEIIYLFIINYDIAIIIVGLFISLTIISVAK